MSKFGFIYHFMSFTRQTDGYCIVILFICRLSVKK